MFDLIKKFLGVNTGGNEDKVVVKKDTKLIIDNEGLRAYPSNKNLKDTYDVKGFEERSKKGISNSGNYNSGISTIGNNISNNSNVSISGGGSSVSITNGAVVINGFVLPEDFPTNSLSVSSSFGVTTINGYTIEEIKKGAYKK